MLVLLVIINNAAADLRDWFVAQGWVSERSRLARMSRRAQIMRFRVVLELLGLDEAHLARYRVIDDPITRRAEHLGRELQARPDISFLRRIKAWTYPLDADHTYRGSQYYLDMMGAVHRREEHEAALELIFLSWLNVLLDRHVIVPFECVLAVKDGNSLLARAVAEVSRKHLILCKGQNDRSRVERPAGDAPHETDFEGLRALLKYEETEREPRLAPRRAVIIDDSCKGGSQVCSAAARFNQHIRDKTLPFHPVGDVVILFRVKGAEGESDDAALVEHGLSVHALLAVGPAELELLHKSDIEEMIRDIDRFKDDELSCARSRELLTANVATRDNDKGGIRAQAGRLLKRGKTESKQSRTASDAGPRSGDAEE